MSLLVINARIGPHTTRARTSPCAVLYEFSQADLSACVNYMQNHLNMMETKRRPVDWITVNYMVCDVQYGGKITDDFDRRLFGTQFF